MDLTKHKKISGIEAIKLILDSGEVFDAHGAKYYIDQEHKTLWYASPFYRTELDRTFNHVLSNEWYVPKPFDVRQAMRENPDEWVGKFRDDIGAWYKVGFDSKQFRAISVGLKSNLSVAHRQGYGTELVYDYDLDRCVPLHEERT
ncbi:hypothetical protein [Exiguobacterium sp. CinTr1]|uniref:hypothetical protein n=1 Tax=Exiguobacterium sp. CinTr1 TaxID=2995315 RepID=UPI0022E41FFE|nr:hypothetical protein [Exiguobacterium sp. CinTr1]